MSGADYHHGRNPGGSGILLEVSQSIQLILATLNYASICRMRSWIDLALMFLTFTLTVGWSVEVGVAVSIVISLFLVIHRSSKARLMILVSHRSLDFYPIPRMRLMHFCGSGETSWNGQVEADQRRP